MTVRFLFFGQLYYFVVCIFGENALDGDRGSHENFSGLDVNIIDTDGNTKGIYNRDGLTIYGKEKNLNYYLVCPKISSKHRFFSLPCFTTKDCTFFGKELLCCNNRCQSGVLAPKRKRTLENNFVDFPRQGCPLEPLVEIFAVKRCADDSDCFPRICCPDSINLEDGYCRTPFPDFDKMPGFLRPLKSAMSYLQCTPPPPEFLDFFPKPCRTQFDCFPNLCCQEKGKKYCRPPKKSLLSLVADFGERFGTTGFAKRFLSRIN